MCPRWDDEVSNLSLLVYITNTTYIAQKISKLRCLAAQYNQQLYTVGVVVQLLEYRTRNQQVAGSTHTRSTANNLEQVANLLCAQANLASYPQRDGKWVVAMATGWKLSVADWGNGESASCTVGPIVH